MELINLKNVESVLEEYAVKVRDAYKDKLLLREHIANGKLYNSVEYRVENNGTEYEVKLTLADYWRYVEYDTKPHFPPVSKILEWIKVKPIIPRPDSSGKIPTQRQLAYLIGRAMAGQSPHPENCKNPLGGTTGTHDLSESIQAVNQEFKDKLVVALQTDLGNFLNVVVGEIKGSMPMLGD